MQLVIMLERSVEVEEEEVVMMMMVEGIAVGLVMTGESVMVQKVR